MPASIIATIVKENENKTKVLQLFHGVIPLMYWFSNFVNDLLKYLFATGISVIIIKNLSSTFLTQ